jgi:hypothetical protein
MLYVRVESSNISVRDIVEECLAYAKTYHIGVITTVEDYEITIDEYSSVDEACDGYYHMGMEIPPPNPKGYSKLIENVRIISKDAAEYLETKAPKLEGFSYRRDLNSCFMWSKTPQGFTYWNNLNEALQKMG